ncbi:hypothetical protein [Desulfolucanica intricata]|uniref:hypothetical protein n=1 Tax=Desulfolucanica intricata TaxID=1285191 RepID=UPI000A73E4CD|nr:hypothetical protein [Desulfolucanica intricata]
MRRRMQGILRSSLNNKSSETTATGYRPVWEGGRGFYRKRQQRLGGPNRPSE